MFVQYWMSGHVIVRKGLVRLNNNLRMEVQTVNLLLETEEILSIDQGIYWIVTSDINTFDNFSKLQNFINDSTYQSKFYLFVLESSEEIKSKAQSSNQSTYLLTPSSKTQLKIESVPWFTCLKNLEFLYSSSEFPSNLEFLKQNDDDLPELKSPEKLPEKISEVILSSVSPELPNFSQLVSKDIDFELNRAHAKISKLRLKMTQQEQTIEDFKVEIKMLKAQLSGKPVFKNNEKNPESTENVLRRRELSVSSKVMKKNKFYSQVDDKEFWKIDENEQFQESLRLDDKVVAQDLWLMGLMKNSSVEPEDHSSFNNFEKASDNVSHAPLKKNLKYSKNLKPPAHLPPLHGDQRKISRSLQRDNSLLKPNPKLTSKNPSTGKKLFPKS
jgi:hypothetical protein